MLVELTGLGLGVISGRMLHKNRSIKKLVARFTLFTIYALLFVLGAKLGGDAALFQALAQLGFQGVIIGLFCTMGSALCVCLAKGLFQVKAEEGNIPGTERKLVQGIIGSTVILGAFCAGLILGKLGLLPSWMHGGNASMYMLRLMLFGVGMGMGFDLNALLIVRGLGWRVLLIPFLIIVGTVAGSVLAAGLLPELSFRSSLAVGAGFGYYSLSSVIITEMGDAALGSVALLSNIFRELFTLLATPFLVRLFGPLSPIGAAAAPSMDTCLPVIVHFSGEYYGFISLFSGLVLTILVPFLVPLALRIPL